MAEIATLAPPQVGNLAEAALGCFKDEMFHLLTNKRIEVHLQQSGAPPLNNLATSITNKNDEKEDTIERIRLELSRAIQEPDSLPSSKPWGSNIGESARFAEACSGFPASVSGFHCGPSSFLNEEDESPWNRNMCSGTTCTAGDQNLLRSFQPRSLGFSTVCGPAFTHALINLRIISSQHSPSGRLNLVKVFRLLWNRG